jgi:hypothetical protein
MDSDGDDPLSETRLHGLTADETRRMWSLARDILRYQKNDTYWDKCFDFAKYEFLYTAGLRDMGISAVAVIPMAARVMNRCIRMFMDEFEGHLRAVSELLTEDIRREQMCEEEPDFDHAFSHQFFKVDVAKQKVCEDLVACREFVHSLSTDNLERLGILPARYPLRLLPEGLLFCP